MSDYVTVAAPGMPFSSRLIAITGDLLIHPQDSKSYLARIVLRWGPHWLPHTWTARQHFARLGHVEEEPRYRDSDVTGWLLLPPEPGSLAEQVRSGRLDIGTALSAEALAWPAPGTDSSALESSPTQASGGPPT